jgi:hypothetical protein
VRWNVSAFHRCASVADHVRLHKVLQTGTLSTSVPLHQTIKRKTLASILRDCHLTADEFRGAL